MKIGSLFAGIGGFDLAARWMGWETAWFSEIDPYASAVLAKHWPGVPNHGDITRIDWSTVEPVDMLCGGFPCQDVSCAGKRKGIDGSRSGLWREYARAIGELRPSYVVVENVAALLGRGIERVLGDLAALGYGAEWHCIPAAYVGAPHIRDRVWIVAYPDSGQRVGARHEIPAGRDAAYRGLPLLAYSICYEWAQPGQSERMGRVGGSPENATDGDVWRTQWETEPDVGRVVDGVPARVDRLRGLGNAIVPQCAYAIFRAIAQAEGLTP